MHGTTKGIYTYIHIKMSNYYLNFQEIRKFEWFAWYVRDKLGWDKFYKVYKGSF